MYKESDFNISTQLGDGKIAYYNTRSGSLIVLDKTPAEFDDDNARSALKKEGFLVNRDIDEFDEIAIDRKRAIEQPDVMNFTIATTMRCQAHCAYCFQATASKKTHMNPSTAKAVSDYISRRVRTTNQSKLSLLWFGGEPLLNKDAIFTIGEKASEECQIRKIPFETSMITNGIAMTPRTIEEMVNRVALNNVQISLEGMRNGFMRSKGIDAFDQVIQNICDCSNIVRITVRMNLMQTNSAELEQLLVYLLDDLSLDSKINIYLAQIESTEGCDPGFSDNASGTYHESEIARLYARYSNRFTSLSPRKLLPVRKKCFCALERKGNYAIGTAGELYKCDRDIGHPSRAIGYITDVVDKRHTTKEGFFDELDEHCVSSKCPMLPTCLSRCPHDRLYRQAPKTCEEILSSARTNIGLAADLLRR